MSCPRCGGTEWVPYVAELQDGSLEQAWELCECQSTAIQLLTVRVGSALVILEDQDALLVFVDREQAEWLAENKGGEIEENSPFQIKDMLPAHECSSVALRGKVCAEDTSEEVSFFPAHRWLELFEVSA